MKRKTEQLVSDPQKEGIPLFLQTQNRKPLSAELQKRLDARLAALRRRPWYEGGAR
jgi:hypothetical protein